ncbi:MAG: hypothetical protein AAFP90_22635, partial [Planctomycetota bacterium]
EDTVSANRTAISQGNSKLKLLKSILGVGELTEAEIKQLRDESAGDADMDAVLGRYDEDMATYLPDYQGTKNYPALPAHLLTLSLDRSAKYKSANTQATSQQKDFDASLKVALDARDAADDRAKDLDTKLTEASDSFAKARNEMTKKNQELADQMTISERRSRAKLTEASRKNVSLENEKVALKTTIESQTNELNRLRSDKFDSPQGEIMDVVGSSREVIINLGSAQRLRRGIQFKVMDQDSLDVIDSETKANIEVYKILGPNLARARVISAPSIDNLIVSGDKIFSAFWRPNDEVRLALAGSIDINGDGQPDNERIRGMIADAGAVLAATIKDDGSVVGQLDNSVRYLIVGNTLEVSNSDDPDKDAAAAAAVAQRGRFTAQAKRLGITVLPVSKMQDFLKTIADASTTPLGSAANGREFLPLG